MNEGIKKILTDMATYEDFQKRVFPAKAYRNALRTVSELDFEVDDAVQLKGLPGIGGGIYQKIDSFLKTGTFPRYEEFKNSAAAQIQEMSKIKGIGMAKAKKLFDGGITSLEALKDAVAGLKAGDKIPGLAEPMTFTNAMKIGLDYEAHTDKTRMSIGEHDKIVYPMTKVIDGLPEVVECSAAGSARRFDGSEGYTVGDVDLIIGVKGDGLSDESREAVEGLLDEIIMSGPTKISGIKDRRQVDIRVVNIADYGALLLHATGPMSFNVACRKIAIKNGWTLNEYGLFDNKTKQCLSKDEEEILDKLGIGWIAPKDRKNFKG